MEIKIKETDDKREVTINGDLAHNFELVSIANELLSTLEESDLIEAIVYIATIHPDTTTYQKGMKGGMQTVIKNNSVLIA